MYLFFYLVLFFFISWNQNKNKNERTRFRLVIQNYSWSPFDVNTGLWIKKIGGFFKKFHWACHSIKNEETCFFKESSNGKGLWEFQKWFLGLYSASLHSFYAIVKFTPTIYVIHSISFLSDAENSSKTGLFAKVKNWLWRLRKLNL